MSDQMIQLVPSVPSKTRIFFVLDRSGSMSSMGSEPISTFNSYVKDQLTHEGEVSLSLILFDDKYDVVFDQMNLKDIPELTCNEYFPRGMTAMNDAIGKTITQYIHNTPENTNTVMVILTDGAENASKEYNYDSVKKLITSAEDDYGWDVIFMASNIDVQQVSGMLGIKGGKFAAMAATTDGYETAIKTLNTVSKMSRGIAQSYSDGTSLNRETFDAARVYSENSK